MFSGPKFPTTYIPHAYVPRIYVYPQITSNIRKRDYNVSWYGGMIMYCLYREHGHGEHSRVSGGVLETRMSS